MRRIVFGALLVGSLLHASIAAADDQKAAEAFQRGAELYGKSDFANAAKQFEKAFAESPRGAAAYNAGLAWEAGGEPARAADAYAAALARADLAGAQLTDAQTRLKNLDKTLGRVEVSGPPGATVSLGHLERAALPAAVRLSPGTWPAKITFADGTTTTKAVNVTASGTTSLVVERAASPPPPVAPAPAPAPAPVPPAPPPRETSAESGGSSPLRVAGFSAIGVGAVLGGAAIVTGVKALSARDEFDASGHTSRDAHDRADSLRTTTNVLLVAAGVLAAGGLVLVLTAPSGAEKKTSLHVGPGSAAVRVRF
jgi:hypothetical protein